MKQFAVTIRRDYVQCELAEISVEAETPEEAKLKAKEICEAFVKEAHDAIDLDALEWNSDDGRADNDTIEVCEIYPPRLVAFTNDEDPAAAE